MRSIYRRLLLLFMPLLAAPSFIACGDDDADAAKEPATVFRIGEITGRFFPTDSLEVHAQGNSIYLHWFGVSGCAGYEIMYAIRDSVSTDETKWMIPENIIDRFIVGPEKADTLIQNLRYDTNYSFAIRVLSVQGEQYHSNWFGLGSNRQCADICQRTTEEQPDTIEASLPDSDNN